MVAGIRLYTKLRKVKGILADGIQALSQGKKEYGAFFIQEELLQIPFRRYLATFLVGSGNRQKTERPASDFFKDTEILSRSMNLRFYMAMPSILIGVGVLGTFVGLAWGIGDFDTDSVEGVRSSISELLAGMSTAFYTSIGGMLCSIAFNVFEKTQFKQVNKLVRELAFRLDERHLMTMQDRLQIQKEEMDVHLKAQFQILTKVLGQLFVVQLKDGRSITPAFMLRDMRTESQEQTKALKAFSTDLADSIKISTEMIIEDLSSRMGVAFQHAMRSELQPALKGMSEAVSSLGSATHSSMSGVVDELKLAIQQMGSQFRDVFVGGALQQLTEVASSLEKTTHVIDQVPAVLGTIMTQVQESFGESARMLGQESMATTQQVRTALTQTFKEIGAASAQQNQEVQAQITRAFKEIGNASIQNSQQIGQDMQVLFDGFKSLMEEAQGRSQALNEQQRVNQEEVHRMTGQMKEVLQSSSALTSNMNQAAEKIGQLMQQLQKGLGSIEGASKSLQQSSLSLGQVTTEFREESKSLQSTQKESLRMLTEALQKTHALSESYATKFAVIEEGLKKIFGEIGDGLESYQRETRQAINTYLGDFADQLKSAATSLAGAVEALSEVMEDFAEIQDKSRKKAANGRR